MENNSEKTNGGVMVLPLCILFDEAFDCSKFHENIDDPFKVIEWIQF